MVASAAAAVAGGSSSAAAYRELAPLNNNAAAVRAAVVGSTVDIVALTCIIFLVANRLLQITSTVGLFCSLSGYGFLNAYRSPRNICFLTNYFSLLIMQKYKSLIRCNAKKVVVSGCVLHKWRKGFLWPTLCTKTRGIIGKKI